MVVSFNGDAEEPAAVDVAIGTDSERQALTGERVLRSGKTLRLRDGIRFGQITA